MKRFFLFSFLFFLSSCSQNLVDIETEEQTPRRFSACSNDLIFTEKAPFWVKELRDSAEDVTYIDIDDQIIFRARQKDDGTKTDVCAAAIEKNTRYIKEKYSPFIQIPITIDQVFFDPETNECFVSTAVSGQLVKKAEPLSKVKKEYDEEMKWIETETERLENELDKVAEERAALNVELKQLGKVIEDNKGYEEQYKLLRNFVVNTKNERRQIRYKIENYVRVGMSWQEVDEIMEGHRMGGSDKGLCGTEWYYRYIDYVICYDDGFVTKYCNLKTKTCEAKEMEE